MLTRSKQARGPEQKEARRRAILAAALALYQEQLIGEITISSIARRAALAKGTVYLYFRTKEEIFVALLLDELSAWAEQLERELPSLSGADVVARRLCEHFLQRAQLVRLMGLMHNVLEQNIEVEAALVFKSKLLEILELGGALIEASVGLSPGEGARFMLRMHATVVGLGQMCRPSAAVEEAMAREPSLQVMVIDFEQELYAMLVAQLNALKPASAAVS